MGVVSVRSVRAQSTPYTVTITAGAFDRTNTVVSFPLPEPADTTSYHLVDEAGNQLPVQVDARGAASVIIDQMDAGTTNTYQLATGSTSTATIKAHERNGAVDVMQADQLVLRYRAEAQLPDTSLPSIYRRGGYVHPVHTPSGQRVTDDYPPSHAHHHGIWAAWTRTAFEGRTPDFWNMPDSTGAVVPMALDTTWSGPVHGGLRARHRYVDRSAAEPRTALHEAWALHVYNTPEGDYHLFDLSTTQSAGPNPLKLLPYHYGGMAVRGRRAWRGTNNTVFLTSAGHDRSTGNETRARWAYIGGNAERGQAGVAVLSHPSNFRAPQPVRIHPEMPYFCFAPSQLGAFSIRPGQPYTARYRFVVFDGPPDDGLLDRLWNDYAYPPGVTVSVVE
jgi:hypothetical protein